MTEGAEEQKTYEITLEGFPVNPHDWDERFALYRAHEMKEPKLTEKHWEAIRILRSSFEKNNLVPTVYDTCEAFGIDLDELQRLFPDGYHRGAVKLAGSRGR